MSFNKIIIVGNLGRNPEVRFTPQGQQVCEFSVATNEKKNNGETETTWFQVTLWGKLAETTSEYLAKGRQVYVEGRLRVKQWEDKEGRTRFTLEINATELKFLGNRSNEDSYEQAKTTNLNTVEDPFPEPIVKIAPAPVPVVKEEFVPKPASKTRTYKSTSKVGTSTV